MHCGRGIDAAVLEMVALRVSGIADEGTVARQAARAGWLAAGEVAGRSRGFHTARPLRQMAAVAPVEEHKKPPSSPVVVVQPEVRI